MLPYNIIQDEIRKKIYHLRDTKLAQIIILLGGQHRCMSLYNSSHSIKALIKPFLAIYKRNWYFAIILWFTLVFPAQALELRVAIKKNVAQLKIGSSTSAVVRNGAGKKNW